jgi:hypothetical protein
MLTEHNSYTLRIELEDFENRNRYAEYQSFKIGNAESKYRLSYVGYSGNAGLLHIRITYYHHDITKILLIWC